MGRARAYTSGDRQEVPSFNPSVGIHGARAKKGHRPMVASGLRFNPSVGIHGARAHHFHLGSAPGAGVSIPL